MAQGAGRNETKVRRQVGDRAWRAPLAVAATLTFAAFGLISAASRADNGRDFAGEFAILSEDAIDSQSTLVTVRLRVQNVSGHSVSGAEVEFVADPMAVEGSTFATQLTLPDRDMAVIEGGFTVPAEKAARWNAAGGALRGLTG